MRQLSLALGGGGVKGISHVGILRRLIKEGYQIASIAGTSAGGLVGAYFAVGHSPDQIENLLLQINQTRLFRRGPHEGPAIMGVSGLREVLETHFGDRTFDDVKIPFACTAVDIKTSQEIIINKGRIVDALLATSAIPGVFPPQEIGEMVLVDGGVLDPVPVSVAQWLSPGLPVVAVVLSPVPEGWTQLPPLKFPGQESIPSPIIDYLAHLRVAQAFNIFISAMDTTNLMLTELRLQAERPDVIIRPDVQHLGILDACDPRAVALLGEEAAGEALPEIEKALSLASSISRRFRRPSLPGKVISPDEKVRLVSN